MSNENATKFIPVRGYDAKINKSEIKDGYVYFATDTGKIYVDSQGQRSAMGAAGAAIYYGISEKVAEDKDTGKFLIPKSEIKNGEPKMGDLILNADGGFYKVEQIRQENYVCELLSVSGTGGGGLSKTRPSILLNLDNTNLINGQKAYFHIESKSALTEDGKPIDTTLNVVYSLGVRISDSVINNYLTITKTYKTGEIGYEGNPGEIDDYIEIGSVLRPDITSVLSVYVQGSNHDEKSYVREIDISMSPMKLSQISGYSPATRYPTTGFDIKCNVVGSLSKVIDFYYDNMSIPVESRVISAKNANTIENFSIGTDQATHGYHTIKIELWQNIGSDEKPKRGLGVEPLYYEIAVVDTTNANAKPVIWFGDYKNEYYNYDTIQIPYLVWDPANTSSAKVHLYRNKVELESSPRDITQFDSFALWEIADAEMDGINTYQISCGETDDKYVEREIKFRVVKDPNRDMTVEKSGLLLDFSTIGRANAESPAKRQVWRYDLNGVKKQAKFENFNWYNNGWIIDNEKNTPNCKDVTRTSCLRISNGAKFTLPFQSMIFDSGVSGNESHTVEMQFRIRNVQKYDNLITNITRYIGDDTHYANFKSQILTGYDNYDAYLQATLSPEDYEDLKFNYVEKNININNIAAGLYDYNSANNKVTGFCIGTQDAFFSNGENTVNVDFVENELINLSFVYQHSLKLLFIYINGVITGVIKSSKGTFSINNSNFVFDSKYCDIDLFKLRIYNTDLNVNQIVKNFSVDRKDLTIFDQSGAYALAAENQELKEYQFSYEAMLKYNEEHPNEPLMPYIIYDTGTGGLPYSKEDTKYITVEFVNTPLEQAYVNGTLEELARKDGLIRDDETDAEKIQEGIKTYYKHHCPSWISSMNSNEKVEFAVQGTSSEFYPRRNYKIKTKMDFENCWEVDETLEAGGKYSEKDGLNIFMNRGPYAEIYVNDKKALAEDEKYIGYEESRMSKGWYMNNYTNPTDRWTMKVDYMESSGSYNAGFASLVGNAYTKHPLKDYYDKGLLNGSENLNVKINSSSIKGIDWNDYRTSLLGFPVLAFQRSGSGENQKYTFLGLYRMLLDKGSSEVLGFKPNKKVTNKFFPIGEKDGKMQYKPVREVAECWEFSNNARGFCSYRDPWNRVELSFSSPNNVPNMYTAKGAPVVANSFEYRYHDAKDDIDVLYEFNSASQDKLNEVSKNLGVDIITMGDHAAGAKALLSTHRNWEKVCKWVWSTNLDAVVSQGTYRPIVVGNIEYVKNVYYIINNEGEYVLSTEDFDDTKTYYKLKENDDGSTEYMPINACLAENLYAPGKYYYLASGKATENDSDDVYAIANQEVFNSGETYFIFEEGDVSTFDEKFDLLVSPVNIETDSYDSSKTYYTWHGTDYDGNNPSACVTIKKGFATGAVRKVETPSQSDWEKGLYYEAKPVTYAGKTYTHDSKEYRAAKFVNEFEKHFDPEYVATYFVMTEVMELYDSRGKNCMMASWGPLEEGGDYIWYPIFYDIDTQLGINNTGIPSFKFNVDATEAGNFSTSDSILWNNFYKFFKDTWILPKYRNLRGNDTPKFNKLLDKNGNNIAPLQSVDYIEKWYNFDYEINKNLACKGNRPLLAKNLDMYFKYITICNEKAKQEGVAHLGGEGSNGAFADPDTGTYFYALQGDRSKSRQQFVGSRLDYIDSWLTQGNYARGGANRLWGRISANNRNDLNAEIEDVHSDKWTHSETDPYWKNNIEFGQKTHEFDAEYWLEPKPIRSSYVTAGDDSMNYPSQKYDGVNQLKFVLGELENGIKTSNNYPEQLLYIYGTNQMSSFGDLSKMYWTEFKLEGKADKLTELKLGHDGLAYDYRNGSATTKSNIPWYNRKLNGITLPSLPLLKEANFCNIGLVNETALDFSTSEKLENFRATGSSNITSVKFADGVALNTLYLPASVGTLSLTQANLLTDLIVGQDNYENPVTDPLTNKLVAKSGLYLENFFDENNSSALNTVKLIEGALGYNSYTILKRLYDINNPKGTNANITMTNVQWCPYTKLSEGDVFDSTKDYYIDDGHYGFVKYNPEGYVYNEKQFNIDILSGKLYCDNGHGGRKYKYTTVPLTENSYKENTYFIKIDVNEYSLATETYDSNAVYYTRETLGFDDIIFTLDDSTITVLKNLYENSNFRDASELIGSHPQISGLIYINNEIPIEESEIYTVLQKYYPNLTFFFTNVTKAYSAKFVLIDKDTGAEQYVDYRTPDGYGPSVQKIKATEINNTYFTNPYALYKVDRSHWDFYGWSLSSNKNDTGSIIYGNITEGMTEEQIIKAHEVAWNAKKNDIIEDGKYDYTFYAILTEHEYEAHFLDAFAEDYHQVSKTAYSDKGSYMNDNVEPPANYASIDLYMRNGFRGWTSDIDKAKIVYEADVELKDLPLVKVSDYPATTNYNFYAIYQKESVFDQVVNDDYFDATVSYTSYRDNYDESYNVSYSTGYTLTLKSDKVNYLKGKITLPTVYKGLPVYRYTGLNHNNNITHIFFDQNNPCEIREIYSSMFEQAKALEYIDFKAMKKLRVINDEAFIGCSRYTNFTFYDPLVFIGKQAFSSAGSAFEEVPSKAVTITLNSMLQELGEQAIRYGVSHKTLIIGEPGKPTQLTLQDWLSMEKTVYRIQHYSGKRFTNIQIYCNEEDVNTWYNWVTKEKFVTKENDYTLTINGQKRD